MASEEHDEAAVSFALPADVGSWLDDQAERRDASRSEICQQLLVAVHAAATDDGLDEPVARADLEELHSHVDAQREEFVDLLEDVRSRVVQVKRETDAKAPAEHDHPDHATDDDLEELADELEELESTVSSGFDNFEASLEGLLDEVDELEERSTVLAKAVVDLREDRNDLAARERRRAKADRLKLAANRIGVRTAACEECDSSVDISMLAKPECPHCGAPLVDVEERTSMFFGSHSLVTGEPPALEGGVADGTDDGREGDLSWAGSDDEVTR